MESNVGINQKVGRNTLTSSEIYKTLSVKATNDGDLVFDIVLNDYIQFIESGRRKGAKMPPVEPIERWYKKKFGETPDNSTIFLIRRAISRDGVKARPILQYVFEEIDYLWEHELSDKLFETILSEVNKFFNS